MIANSIRLIARSSSTNNLGPVIRNATIKDVDTVTRRAIKEGWHVGPYDYQCAFDFDPKGMLMCELDGELVSHVKATRYPGNHSHVGLIITTDKYRKQGYYQLMSLKILDACDKDYTVGVEAGSETAGLLKRMGGKNEWKSYIATLRSEKVTQNLAEMKHPSDVSGVKSIHRVNLEKLLEYDCHVFGTGRQIFMERWINAPGTFGFAVEKSDDLAGYIVIKQVIRGGGTEIGLSVAPFYADNAEIAKLLLKTTAEYCLSNEAVPKTTLEMYHPVGDNCGQDAPQLMNELEAELTHIGYRMYNKGIPPGRQLKKIYGITSPSFD